MVLYGSNMGNASSHESRNLPIWLALDLHPILNQCDIHNAGK